MKTVNKIVMGLLCLGVIGFTGCNGGDDNGPSEPENIGSFTGTFTSQINGQQSDFVAETATAVQDTSIFNSRVTITATNAAGDVVTIVLSDTAEAYYQITPSSFNLTTYKNATDTATSQTDDIGANLQSSVQITGNGKSDTLSGNSPALLWVLVNPDDDDQAFGVMQDVTFSAPITRTGSGGGFGGDVSVAATIDGSAFNPTTEYSTMLSGGFLIVASTGVASMTVNIPENATTGDHDLAQFQNGYSIYYTPDGANAYTSASGNMHITAIDATAGTVSGTFSCVAGNPSIPGTTVNITNGTFSVE